MNPLRGRVAPAESTVYGTVSSVRCAAKGASRAALCVLLRVPERPIRYLVNHPLTMVDASLTGRHDGAIMSYRAAIGPMDFVFTASGITSVPAVTGRPVHLIDAAPMLSVEEEGAVFLVLDHRGARTSQPAYVELWRPASATEAPVQGMFILASAQWADVATDEQPATLARLAERLIG
jgi:hypothetical protein